MSHAGFLREQHPGPEDDVITLIRGLLEAGEAAAELPLREGVDQAVDRIDTLVSRALSFADDAALLRFVVRLTLAPRLMTAERVDALRASGLSDRDIHDVVNVVCCFSYMNRLADGLGVTSDWEPGGWAERLMGEERLEAHRRWAAGG